MKGWNDRIEMTKISENGVLGIRLSVECSNDVTSASAKIKVTQMGPATSDRLTKKLNLGLTKFLDHFYYAFLHRISTETLEKCSSTCEKVYWGKNCCAKVKMGTELYENGVAFFDSSENYYCLKREVANANKDTTFSDIDFTMSCSSGATILKAIGALALASISYI